MKILRKVFKAVKSLIFILIAVAVVYLAYVLISTDRVGDTDLEVTAGAEEYRDKLIPVNKKLSAVTYNIGFGAYTEDFSFFMDGGESSRAQSEDTVYENLAGITGYLSHRNPDITLMQEVDEDGTRSHHVNEVEAILRTQQDKWSTYAVNYDSAYLMYPLNEPHGKNRSGIITMTRYPVYEAFRVELPIEGFPSNLTDLDRCYTKTKLLTSDGVTYLTVYNLHLSAYSDDGEITALQLRDLLADMQAEYDAGGYVIAGGDFNMDLLEDSSLVFGCEKEDASWAKAFPTDSLSQDFTLYAPSNAPSCRNADTAYDPESSFVITLDGYIVSNNIEVTLCQTDDLGFAYSDHNPVRMEFKLIWPQA